MYCPRPALANLYLALLTGSWSPQFKALVDSASRRIGPKLQHIHDLQNQMFTPCVGTWQSFLTLLSPIGSSFCSVEFVDGDPCAGLCREYYTKDHYDRAEAYTARCSYTGTKESVYCKQVHAPGCRACKTCHFCR
jgi:hypothetical protein